MSADLLPFTYVNTTVRVVMIDDQPWFVLADLCVVLGIANVGNVADRLDQVNIRRTDVENARGQMRQTVVVNEAGMYEVVIRSDKPEAVAFRRWITGTVLPEIRRTGSFKAVPATALTEDEIVHQALAITARRVEELTAKVAELEPSATAWDTLQEIGADYEVADAAKILSRDPRIEIGRNRLFEFMHDQDWIYRGRHNTWKAYQDQVDLGRLIHRPGGQYFHKSSGEYRTGDPTILVTPKGLAELRRLLGGRQLELVASS